MNIFFKNKEIRKCNCDVARWHKSVIDCFMTSVKTSKVIQDIIVYRSNEIDSEHYLLCAKIHFPPQ